MTLPDPVQPLPWDRDDHPAADTVAARLRAEGVEPYAWSNRPGDRYAVHEHGYTKLLMCAAGSITFLVGPDAAAVELGPGDGVVLPAGTPHGAVVGPHGCTCVEGHR
ncbi:MAG TPA: AraC family ligand binding domain-containing protein [Candidatus Limnocylindria bacterium]|nr:AraC family ligand binding domain-containing protein [Candidatus Limnocylindria bacterium]